MIPFDELVHALERFKRRKSGQAAVSPSQVAAQATLVAPQGAHNSGRIRDASLEFSLDEVEEA
mgnify:FL=1